MRRLLLKNAPHRGAWFCLLAWPFKWQSGTALGLELSSLCNLWSVSADVCNLMKLIVIRFRLCFTESNTSEFGPKYIAQEAKKSGLDFMCANFLLSSLSICLSWSNDLTFAYFFAAPYLPCLVIIALSWKRKHIPQADSNKKSVWQKSSLGVLKLWKPISLLII